MNVVIFEICRCFQQELVGLAQLAHFTLQRLEPIDGTPACFPVSTSRVLTHSFSICAEQPIFSATETVAAHRDGCPPHVLELAEPPGYKLHRKTPSKDCSSDLTIHEALYLLLSSLSSNTQKVENCMRDNNKFIDGKIEIPNEDYVHKRLFSYINPRQIVLETKKRKESDVYFDIKLDNNTVGYFFPHDELMNILCDGKTSGFREKTDEIRSLFLLTNKSAIKSSKLLDQNDDWHETSLESEYLNDILEKILHLSKISKEFNNRTHLNYLYHVLTHGEKAEKIWRLIADNLSEHMTLNYIPSDASFEDSSNKDGGIDDLRETKFGLMATQVKGGKIYRGSVVESEIVANNFFITTDPNKFSNRARKKRIQKWSFLSKPFEVPIMENSNARIIKHADDALLIHYLAVGKNCPRDLIQKGTSASWPSEPPQGRDERFLYVTGLDIIVLNRFDTITELDTTMTSQDGYLFLKAIVNALNIRG